MVGFPVLDFNHSMMRELSRNDSAIRKREAEPYLSSETLIRPDGMTHPTEEVALVKLIELISRNDPPDHLPVNG